MKKWFITFCLMAAIGVACVAVARYMLPLRSVSPLYLRFEHTPGVAATYIHAFPVGDTLRMDITLLEATSDSGWVAIERAFAADRLPSYGPDASPIRVSSTLCRRGHPEQRMDILHPDSNELKCIDREARVACLFHARNRAECDSALLFKYNNYKNQSNTTK